jgi:copper transport protein
MDVSTAQTIYVLARYADYVGMVVFVGGLLFVALLWPAGSQDRRARAIIVSSWLTGLVSTVATIGLQGVWAFGRPVADFLDADLFGQVLGVEFGRVWFAKGLLWVLSTVVLVDLMRRGGDAARSTAWRVGAGAVAVGLLRTTAMTGHSSDASGLLWAQVGDLLHLAGICAWIGGLAMLLCGVLPRRRPEELASVVPRYSRLATTAVLSIVIGGAVLGWQIVGSVGALSETDYGQLLLLKIGAFAVVLIAAWYSRNWVARRLDFAVVLRGHGATVRPFVYSVIVETVIVVFVLLAASFLVTASPGQ